MMSGQASQSAPESAVRATLMYGKMKKDKQVRKGDDKEEEAGVKLWWSESIKRNHISKLRN